MTSAILYVRVDTAAESVALKTQSYKAIPFCNRLELYMIEVVEEISDLPAVKRPKFSALLDDIIAGKKRPKYLIIPEWTTLAKYEVEAVTLIFVLNKLGIKVLCAAAPLKAGTSKNSQ